MTFSSAAARPVCDAQPHSQPVERGGGETACWAHLLCPECGVVLDGGAHTKDCSFSVRP
jgi:hypothetical protein